MTSSSFNIRESILNESPTFPTANATNLKEGVDNKWSQKAKEGSGHAWGPAMWRRKTVGEADREGLGLLAPDVYRRGPMETLRRLALRKRLRQQKNRLIAGKSRWTICRRISKGS
ncbi:hypothetical protein BT69DRAFT_1281851 [Atractiella rhizophila]|nr:hypothetical protein BT69DRAFT_1281851 [Atractiella rhizophila]